MLLAIDTSTRTAGVALYDGACVRCEFSWTSRENHTVELAPAVSESMRRAGCAAAELKAIGVALGPGSFTGLRSGLALAKGLALAQHIPLIGVPTLDFLAAAQPLSDAPLAAVLQAGRTRLAVGWYHAVEGRWQPDGSAEVLTLAAFSEKITQPTLVCGELNAEERAALGRKWKNVLLASPAQSLRRPAMLAELAWERWQARQTHDPATLAPIYLHIGDPIPE